MRIFLSIILLAAFITSCSGGSDKEIDPGTGLTKDDYTQAKSINDAIEDVRSAVEIGLSRMVPARVPSEKAVELSKGITKSNCTLNEYAPAENYEADWAGERSVSGPACPLSAVRKWNFKSASRRLEFSEQFAAQSEEFKNKSGAQSFAIDQGYLYRDNSSDSIFRTYGKVRYSNIFVRGVGLVVAEINSTQETMGTRVQGQLVFEMQTRSNLFVRLEVNWFSGRETRYRINGTAVDESVVTDLFSAFGIKEMIDRSQKMR